MHDHVKNMIENILDLIAQSISLYLSVNEDNISEMNKASLNSIVQSKENSLNLLYNEYKKINPNYNIKSYGKTKESQEILQSKIHSIEKEILSTIDKELLQNIPLKAHDGIYTIAQSLKSNCETSMIKLNSIINLRKPSSETYSCLINTTYYVIEAMELYRMCGLMEQMNFCSNLLDENKKLMREMYSKKLIFYSPKYGDTYAGISKKFDIDLTRLVKENHITNPYSKTLTDNILIVIDETDE